MKVVWQVEKDEWCSRVLSKHWPTVPRWGDIEDFLADAESAGQLRAEQLENDCEGQSWRGSDDVDSEGEVRAPDGVDLICGGFPCQPVSLAGKRKGRDDARWLWPQFARAVGLLRPRYVLVENVPGLLTNGGVGVIESLTELGYDTEWDLLSAASVGAPHLRKRIFIVAYADETELRVQPAGQSRSSGTPVARDNGTQEPVAHAGQYSSGTSEESSSEVLSSRRREEKRGHWAVEPSVGRVANGVPKRVDRLRGLGNAVVPQVAEYVGRRIMELDG